MRKNINARIAKADGGKEVSGAPLGSYARRARWEEREWFDAEQVKAGIIDPEKGEVEFYPEDEIRTPRTDRTYRAGEWRPASDAVRGTPVSMPYLP